MEDKEQRAFPQLLRYDDPTIGGGLTKRELFAAMAMQGLLANREWTDCPINRTPDMKSAEVVIVEMATDAADALIAELNRTEPIPDGCVPAVPYAKAVIAAGVCAENPAGNDPSKTPAQQIAAELDKELK